MDAERGGREIFLGAGHLDAADDLRKAHAHVVLQHTGEIGLVIMERSRQRAQAHGTVVLLDILQNCAAVGTGRFIARGAKHGGASGLCAEHGSKEDLCPAHGGEIRERRLGRALLDELVQRREHVSRLKVRRHAHIIHFILAVHRFAEENAHFVAARHEIAELRIKRGAAHMQRYDVRVRRDGLDVRRVRRNDDNAADADGDGRSGKEELALALENDGDRKVVILRGIRAQVGENTRHGNIAAGRKDCVLTGNMRRAGLRRRGVLKERGGIHRLRINDLTDLFHGMLDLGIGRGNSTRSGKEIVLFHHIKRLAKGGANAGLAVIGREKLLELLYRCL